MNVQMAVVEPDAGVVRNHFRDYHVHRLQFSHVGTRPVDGNGFAVPIRRMDNVVAHSGHDVPPCPFPPVRVDFSSDSHMHRA